MGFFFFFHKASAQRQSLALDDGFLFLFFSSPWAKHLSLWHLLIRQQCRSAQQTQKVPMLFLVFPPMNVNFCSCNMSHWNDLIFAWLGLIWASSQQLWLSSSLPSRQSSSPSHFHKARMQRWLWHWNSSLLHRCGSKAPPEASGDGVVWREGFSGKEGEERQN